MAAPLSDIEADVAARMRWLRWLVTALALTMIGGVIAIVALLWVRLGAAPKLPDLPDAIVLPQGQTAQAVTFARTHTVVVTQTNIIMLFDQHGRLVQTVRPAQPGD